jgi:hypothetical protein
LYIGAPHEIPNQEYVKITNYGNKAVNMKDWKIKDEGEKHTYFFPDYILKPKSTVTLRSGSGRYRRYIILGKYSFISNNTGDTAYLYSAQGELIGKKIKYGHQ